MTAAMRGYVPDRLLITRPDRMTVILRALRRAADEMGWDVVAETLDGRATEPADLERGAAAARESGRAPGIHLVRIVAGAGASPVDAERLLRRARDAAGGLDGVTLDRIMTVDEGGLAPVETSRPEQEQP